MKKYGKLNEMTANVLVNCAKTIEFIKAIHLKLKTGEEDDFKKRLTILDRNKGKSLINLNELFFRNAVWH